MGPLQPRCCSLSTQRLQRAISAKALCRQRIPLSSLHRSHPVTGSYHSAISSRSLTSSTEYDAVTHQDTAVVAKDADGAKQNGNVSINPDTGTLPAGTDPQSSWGTPASPEEDWRGSQSFTLKDVDWGLAGLLGVILFLSFGAYRVLNHFRVYNRPKQPQITTLVERTSSSTTAAAPASSKPKSSKSRSKQDKANKSSTSSTTSAPAFPAAAAALAAEGATVPANNSSSSTAAQQPSITPGDFSSAAGGATAAVADVADATRAVDPALAPSFDDLPGPSLPGAPQPSPLDAGFSSMPTPWGATGLGHMDLGTLPPLPQGPAQPPELPSIQVDPPAKAVSPSELQLLPSDPSLPSLRERAHIAMRASGAAMEASQRAAAYSAAASSAASRAAEAAEQAAVAASAVQTALETAAEEAMAEAVKRMNRAVEMVADAESRAAAAAAMATAYQDISDTQAAAAAAAADLPQMPAKQTPQGHIANLRKVLHEQLFDIWGLLADWIASVWAAIVGVVVWLQTLITGLWAKTLGGVFAGAKASSVAGPTNGTAAGPTAGPAAGGSGVG